MRKANIGLSEEELSKSVESLNKVLASTFILYLKTHNFHWNVVGNRFQPLHSLFEEQYEELWKATDVIAESIRGLGAKVIASAEDFSKLSIVKEITGYVELNQKEMLAELLKDHEAIIRYLHQCCGEMDTRGDYRSADLMVERLDIQEKTAWMLRSFLEE